MQYLTVDNVEYRVRVVYGTLSRSFNIVEGPNSGTAITAKEIRDILGTGYSYTMEVVADPQYPGDYDAFYEVVSSPEESHRVTLPYGQSSLAFDAVVHSGEDVMGATLGGVTRWSGLKLTFTPLKPQKEAT